MSSKNQQKKALMREKQALLVIRALEQLIEDIELYVPTPNLMEERLEVLAEFIRTYSDKNDISNFKNLVAFSKYHLFLQNDRAEKVRKQVKQNQKTNLKYTSFRVEILEAYFEGKSNEEIAEMIRQKGVKCNRETIRLFIKNRHNEESK